MPTGGWRFIAQRVTGDGTDGEFLDLDVPLRGVEVTDNLSGFNSLTGVISPEIARLLGPDGEPIFDEWGTAIWAEAAGEIRGGGIITSSGFNGPDWQIDCTGYAGYLQDLPYTDAWFGVEIDPLDVVRHIWDHVQGKPGGDLGLDVSDLKTGVKIGLELEQVEFDTESGPIAFESGPVKLAWYQTHDLAAEVERLAKETPFDWHERHYWDGDQIKHRLDFGYPRIGRRRIDLRFVVGENVSVLPSVDRDGSLYASEALVLGAGEGRKMRRGESSTQRGKRLRRVAVVTDPSLRSVASANRRAVRELQWRKETEEFTELVVRDHPHARVGSLKVGDEILVEGRTGWVDLDHWVRVTSIAISPEAGNAVSLSVVRSDRL